ncbi:MAG: hypothetical protein AAF690_14715 [Acidobacteriota bacterium]
MPKSAGICFLFLWSAAIHGQTTLVAEGMITPKDATTAAEIVIVQAPTSSEQPGPPMILSEDPPRLLLASQRADSNVAFTRTMEQSAGRLGAATWEAVSYSVDWTSGTPRLEGTTGPGTFVVSRGEVFPSRLSPSEGRGFELVVTGPWENTCLPTLDRVVTGRATIDVYAQRTDTVCVPATDDPGSWREQTAVRALAAGRYEVRVLVPTLSNPLEYETYATASLRVVALDRPALRSLRLEADVPRGVEVLVAEVERPVTATGNGCTGWRVKPRNAWVHGRDVYAEFEIEEDTLSCIAATTLTFDFPLPRLTSGLYRLIARHDELGSTETPAFWGQSPTLVRSRPPSLSIDGRFELSVRWKDFSGNSGYGAPALPEGSDSAIFYFFDEDNWELLAKVLDGCSINGHYWVFASASTDVEYQLTVRDLARGQEKRYSSPLGEAAAAITDTAALPCE